MSLKDIQKKGLGVLGPNPKAYKDYKLPGLVTIETPLDWVNGFEIPELPGEDQGSSGSCTEQAFCYDFNSKNKVDLSRRDGYSNIGSPVQAGAFPNEPFDNYNTRGQYTRAQFPDPVPQTEQNMKEKIVSDLLRHKVYKVKYWSPTDFAIDTIARMIKTYNGMTGCFNITWEGWSNPEFPRAPKSTDNLWAGSHMVYLRGFKMIDGKKMIIADSSWDSVCKRHYFGEDYYYVGAQHVFGHYAAEYREVLNDMEFVVIEYKGKLGIGLFDGGFVETIAWAKDKQQLLDLCKGYGITPVGYDPSGYPLPTHQIKKIR
jgi:hypothetical protein